MGIRTDTESDDRYTWIFSVALLIGVDNEGFSDLICSLRREGQLELHLTDTTSRPTANSQVNYDPYAHVCP
jgi:hypothetical protein